MTARLCPGTCSGCRSAEPALRGRTDGKGRTRDGAPGTGHGTAYVKVVKMAHLHHVYFIPQKTNTRQGKVEPVKASEMQSAPCPRSDVLIYLKTPSPESGVPAYNQGLSQEGRAVRQLKGVPGLRGGTSIGGQGHSGSAPLSPPALLSTPTCLLTPRVERRYWWSPQN